MIYEREQDWNREGARAATWAERPDDFIMQHAAPLLYHPMVPAEGRMEEFYSEEALWDRSQSITFASVRLHGFRLSEWFPRAPGVYWSRHGLQAREYTYSDGVTNDPELGLIYSPKSKMALIEEGGIGTIRLRPRRIEGTYCWLATAVKGRQCAGGVPLVLPHSFLADGKVAWGDTAIFEGTVRFLQDAELHDTAAYVHHATPLIIFVEDVKSLPKREQSTTPITLTPVALFDLDDAKRWDGFGYTFVQHMSSSNGALSNDALRDAADWIEKYAAKHGGRIITNFDERSPILSNAPLSYQRLVQQTYDRRIIQHFHLERLADRIDLAVKTEYNNYGQAGAIGDNARSDNNTFLGERP
jgi:hypothetical protein